MDIYNYPFKHINEFLEFGIDKKLIEFYSSFENEIFGPRVLSVDRNKKLVLLKKDSYFEGETEYMTFTFEAYIKSYFQEMVYKSINIIENGLNIIFISDKSTFLYLDTLERQLSELLKNNRLKTYPFLNVHMSLLINEIHSYKRLIEINSDFENILESPFKPKNQLRRSFFYELHKFCIQYDLISIDFPSEDFIEVFCNFKTGKKIKFSCENSLFMLFFLKLAPSFDNLNRTSISKSERFLTSQNSTLSSGIFDISKTRLKKKEKEYKDFISSFDNLLAKYS